MGAGIRARSVVVRWVRSGARVSAPEILRCGIYYEALASALRALKGKAILTINDHPDIRKLLDWLPHDLVPIHYTIGGGKGAPRREVIYRTWS